MLRDLKLEKYRGFDDYELVDLSRVNLLVGRNNCGKTSILEALHFLVLRGDPFVLTRSANRRGEVGDGGSRSRHGGPNISHFFFGHHFGHGAGFRLSGKGHGHVSTRVRAADVTDESRLLDDETDQFPPLMLQIESSILGNMPGIPVTENGSLLNSRLLRFRNPWLETALLPPVQFVTPDSLDVEPMREVWDRVLTEGRESEAIEAMTLLEEELESIHFLTSDNSRARTGRAGVLLGFRGAGRRVPLGSYGDGMRRLLALSLALIQAANGVLLIDEIDAGLHWTVMEDMWRLVIDTARKSSLQVFATTHSADCIRGLASLVESHADLAGDISIQKIERSLSRAVRLDAEGIRVAVEQNIEVR